VVQIFVELLRENHHIVYIRPRISTVFPEEVIYIALNIGRRVLKAYNYDLKDFLSAVGVNDELIAVRRVD